MARARRHAHKYHRVTTTFGKVWACALPDCTHYMPQHMENLLPGKQSICWNCEEIFVLNPMNMKDEQPVCDECKGSEDLGKTLSELEKRFINSGQV